MAAQAPPNHPAVYDVVVIGAGISGLVVATEVAKSGRTVIVLEARNRVGGRLLTAEDGAGAGGDFGAAWFWPGERRVARLAADLGVPTFPQHVAGVALVDNGSPRPQPYGDWEKSAGPSFRFRDGAQSLPLRLAERLPPGVDLRLGVAVTGVSLESGTGRASGGIAGAGGAGGNGGSGVITVTASAATGGGPLTFRCGGAVVVALPPALCAVSIAFYPPLFAELDALARRTPTWMARTAKTLVRFKTPFWREQKLAGVGFSRAGPLSEIHDHSGPADGNGQGVLFGFSQGARPEPAAVIAQLVRLFGPKAATPLSVVTHEWADEVFTSGVPGSGGAGPERGDMDRTYGNPMYAEGAWGGRVLFCSTETGRVAPGHIEGALDAANRTVEAILATSAAQPPLLPTTMAAE